MVVDATHGTVQPPTGDPGRVHTGEMALAWAVVEVPAPIRALTVGVTEVGLALLAFGDRPDLAGRAASRLGEPLVSDPALTEVATRQLTEYLAGDRQVFDLPLDWRLSAGSGLRVLQALYETVPFGETAVSQCETDEPSWNGFGANILSWPALTPALKPGTKTWSYVSPNG